MFSRHIFWFSIQTGMVALSAWDLCGKEQDQLKKFCNVMLIAINSPTIWELLKAWTSLAWK